MKTLVRNYDSLPSLINDFFTYPTASLTSPSANIKEGENEFMIDLMVPGYSKEDIKIEINEPYLNISSEVKNESEVIDEKHIRKEFYINSFSRSFKLPKSVNIEAISAKFENGILSLVLPKKEEAKPKEPRLISIN